MVQAFEIFKEIQKLELNDDKKRLWMKQYEGKKFSIGEKEKDLIYWKQNEKEYVYFDSLLGGKNKNNKRRRHISIGDK